MKKTLLCALLFLCAAAGSGQPLKTTLASPGPLPPGSTSIPIVLRISNDSLLNNYTNITLQWEIWANGSPLQKGTVPNINALPHRATTVRLPIRVPKEDKDELLLQLTWRPTPHGRTITQPLLVQGWTGNENYIPSAGELTWTDDNNHFTIQSPAMQVVFDKQTGWLLHYIVHGVQLAIDSNCLRPDLGLPDSVSPRLQLFSSSTGSQIVIIRTEYSLGDAAWRIHLSYTINAAGEIQVLQQADADTTQKLLPLPRYGTTWLLPPGYDSVTWYGQMTAAGLPGVEQAVIHDRDQSTIPAIRWTTLTNEKRKGLRLTADSALFTLQTNPPSPGTPAGKALSIIASPSACSPDCTSYRLCYKFTPTP